MIQANRKTIGSAVYSGFAVTFAIALANSAIMNSASANPAPVVFVQNSGRFGSPVLVSPQINAGGSSSSSSSSSFVNSSGAGASSTATATSPAGTSTSSQTVFTPGATSSSATATATSSTNGPNTTNATAIAPGNSTPNLTSPNLTSPNVITLSPAIAGNGITLPILNNAVPIYSPPTVPPVLINSSLPATFISSFNLPKSENTYSGSYQVIGLPSRVFPGLGLKYAPE